MPKLLGVWGRITGVRLSLCRALTARDGCFRSLHLTVLLCNIAESLPRTFDALLLPVLNKTNAVEKEQQGVLLMR